MASYGELSLFEKLELVPIILRSLFAGFSHLLTSPIRGSNGATTWSRHAVYSITRTLFGITSIRQQHFISPPTDQVYLDFVSKKKLTPETTVLEGGGKGHWLGNKNANKIIVFYHGGGYALPAGPQYFEFVSDILTLLKSQGQDVAAVLLSYTVTPYASYPTQIAQAVSLLRHLVEVEGKNPSNIVIGGDSAGGNLSLAVLSHLLHPHPSSRLIPSLKLSSPLAGALLISPWVSFDPNLPACTSNASSDMIPASAIELWGTAYLGGKKSDGYAEAVKAPAGWWKGLSGVVKEILVTGGTGEILIDSIKELTEQLQQSHGSVTEVMVAGGHDEPVLDYAIQMGKGEAATAIDSWVGQAFSK